MSSKEYIATVSKNHALHLPPELLTQLGILVGDQILITVTDDKLILEKVPNKNDWHEMLNGVPIEKVEIGNDGNYDPEKLPKFDDWMRNG